MTCRGSNEAVACRHDIAPFLCFGSKFSPHVANLYINEEYAISIMLLKSLQPASEVLLLFPVFEKADTFHNFPDGYDTEKKTLAIDQVDGAAYARIALRMAQLRKYTSIQ